MASAISPLTLPTALVDALAQVGVAAVAQLRRLELARRGAGRHGRAALRARAQRQLDLHGRVAAGVEDLAGVDGLDLAHVARSSFRRARA